VRLHRDVTLRQPQAVIDLGGGLPIPLRGFGIHRDRLLDVGVLCSGRADEEGANDAREDVTHSGCRPFSRIPHGTNRPLTLDLSSSRPSSSNASMPVAVTLCVPMLIRTCSSVSAR